MSELTKVHTVVLDEIYVALSDAEERLGTGVMQFRRCLNYLETPANQGGLGYEPPVESIFKQSPELEP